MKKTKTVSVRVNKLLPDIERLPSDTYLTVIQVNVPTRWYWAEDGFDGIEIGPFNDDLTTREEALIANILLTLSEWQERDE